MPDDVSETLLTGGGRTVVVRRGDIVARETGPWAASVHALLRHLEHVGFDGAPRVVGSGFDARGRELLTYVGGEIVNPAPWSDEAIGTLGALLRSLHDATTTFEVPATAVWRDWFGRGLGTPDIIGHCDTSAWNVVARDGDPVAFIDWEVAGPVAKLTEIAMAAWTNVHLYDDDIAAMHGLPDAPVRMRQVRLLAESYGLPAKARHELADRIIWFAAESAAHEVIEQ